MKNKKKDNLTKQGKNKKKPATGFHTNPERINRKGRPPTGESWADILRQIGEEIHPRTGKPFKEAVSRKIWNKAVGGDVQSIKEIMNRMDGMPAQRNIHEGDDDRPIPVDVKLIISQIYGNKTNTPTEVSNDSQKRRKSSRSS